MHFRLYYCDWSNDVELTADGARATELGEILETMDRVLVEPGSFLGVMDEKGGILQFLVGDDGRIGVEIPDACRRGHYGKQADLQECKGIVRNASAEIVASSIPGLQFEKW